MSKRTIVLLLAAAVVTVVANCPTVTSGQLTIGTDNPA